MVGGSLLFLFGGGEGLGIRGGVWWGVWGGVDDQSDRFSPCAPTHMASTYTDLNAYMYAYDC